MGKFLDSPKGRNLFENKKVGRNLLEDPEQKQTISKNKGKLALYAGLAGPTGFYSEKGSEGSFPLVGQIAGSAFGGFPGAVGGATLGEAAKQGVKQLRGETPDYRQIPKTAAITAAGEGIFRGGSKLLKPMANRMMLSIMKPARDVTKRFPTLGIDALESGIRGSKKGMLGKAEDLIEASMSKIDDILSSKKGTVNIKKAITELEKLKSTYLNVGDDASVNSIDDLIGVVKSKSTGMMPLNEANLLKRDLYKVLKDSNYGKGIGDLAAKTLARKSLAHNLKEGIEEIAPEIGPENKKVQTALNVAEALRNRIGIEGRQMILPKLAGMGAGGAVLAGQPAIGGGILLGDLGIEALRSAPVLSNVAGALNWLAKRKLGGQIGRLGASELGRQLSYKMKG